MNLIHIPGFYIAIYFFYPNHCRDEQNCVPVFYLEENLEQNIVCIDVYHKKNIVSEMDTTETLLGKQTLYIQG